MNLCIISGKIVSEIEFKFIIGNKYKKSIAYFDLELRNKCVVRVCGYNEVADYVLRNFSNGMIICVEGKVSNDKIVLENCYNF